ncbi:hypothetical protein Avbf_02389 [Armadillidium vulgare]|nr:hypothetical protein Avbf_02389 [Armadillidium vulgare]
MKEENFDEMKTLIKESFGTREPLGCGLHIEKEEVLEYFGDLAKEWIQYQPSVCAIYVPQNKIVAINFTKILTRDKQETFNVQDISRFTPGMQKFIKIILDIESSCNIFKQDETIDKILEIALLTVDSDFSGNKLAYRMNEESERIARKLGCQAVSVIATNKISQQIYRNMGYENRLWIDYKDVEVDISAMNGSSGINAFMKYL